MAVLVYVVNLNIYVQLVAIIFMTCDKSMREKCARCNKNVRDRHLTQTAIIRNGFLKKLKLDLSI